jgi:two-component system cell cycle response regulator
MARVLVIEDNELNLELMVCLLQAYGHEIDTARNGDDGVAKARAGRYDLILCDVQMPGRDGYVVAAELKSEPATAGVPLVAVTAHAMVGDRDNALAVGFDAHFPKPIDPPAFITAVESMLAAAQPSVPVPLDTAGCGIGSGTVPMTLRAPWPGATLLLVDDTPANLEFKSQLFEPAGYRVLTARSVKEAHELLAATAVDLVVCDVVMPQASGFDLLRELRGRGGPHGPPFVFLTSSTYNNLLRKLALSMGADRFLTRPLPANDLLGEIRTVLEHSAQG